jgi:hypothetical protein
MWLVELAVPIRDVGTLSRGEVQIFPVAARRQKQKGRNQEHCQSQEARKARERRRHREETKAYTRGLQLTQMMD